LTKIFPFLSLSAAISACLENSVVK